MEELLSASSLSRVLYCWADAFLPNVTDLYFKKRKGKGTLKQLGCQQWLAPAFREGA